MQAKLDLENIATKLHTDLSSVVDISSSEHLWYVSGSDVDVYFESSSTGIRQHYKRYHQGDIILGGQLKDSETVSKLILKGESSAQLYQISLSTINELDIEYLQVIMDKVEYWISECFEDIIQYSAAHYHPRSMVEDLPGRHEAGALLGVAKGVVWAKFKQGSAKLFMDPDRVIDHHDAFYPISQNVWLTAIEPCEIEAFTTQEVITRPEFWPVLFGLHNYAMALYMIYVDSQKIARSIQIIGKTMAKDVYAKQAAQVLVSSFSYQEPKFISHFEVQTKLSQVMIWLCRAMKIDIKIPNNLDESMSSRAQLDAICHHAKIMYRHVMLEEDWHKREHGMLLVLSHDDTPHGLCYHQGQYKRYDLATQRLVLISKDEFSSFRSTAYSFCRHLPGDQPVRLRSLAKLSFSEDVKTVFQLVCAGILTALLGMIIPIMTKILFDEVVPFGAFNLLYQIASALILVTLVTLLISYATKFIVTRLLTRSTYLAESALYDRLVKLPASFFSEYSTGDILDRISGIQQLRMILGTSTLMAILSSIFSILSLALMFYYHPPLALVSFLIVGLSAVISFVLGRLNLKYTRLAAEKRGKLAGVLTELINGMSIIRSHAAESKAFLHWAQLYTQLSRVNFRAFMLGICITSVNTIMTLISTLIIFSFVFLMSESNQSLSIGTFMAFYAAFGQFSGGVMGLVNTVVGLLNVIPLYERAKPILQTIPEMRDDLNMPDIVDGKIELDHITFKYPSSRDNILNDVSLKFEPGKLVAIVGPSGSGKSTIIRLILGLEKPSNGRIYYDNIGHDSVDISQYRSHIGVVLQSDNLSSGSIFDNVAGMHELNEQDVWDLLELVNLAKDIAAMPMRLHTSVGIDGSGLSGGQRQRLMIARALAHKPKILVLDEATSALDNISQRIITDSLAKLKITRIVVAHRLSTVQGADLIYVVKDGQVIEMGNYAELMSLNGHFYALASTQLSAS